MAMSLPLGFRGDGGQVVVETDAAHAPLRDFLLDDLGENVAAIVRAKARVQGGTPWRQQYRHHRLDFDGTVVRVADLGGRSFCDLFPAIFRACLDEYLRQVAAVRYRRTLERTGPPPGDEVAAALALGGTSRRGQGWGLVQTPRATLEDMAGLTPHPDECLPHGVLGSGACWADLAVLDGTDRRLRSGTKTFLPRGLDATRIAKELEDALTRARFVGAVPGAWAATVAGVPVHGYVDPDAVRRLPCAPVEAAGVMQHVRVLFPQLTEPGAELEAAADEATGAVRGLTGSRHVLTAFLLHDVQSHHHHLEVVRGARPGWEHSGNASHLRLDVRTARLDHLWLTGHACELPTGEFARALDRYERSIGNR
ncbi:hypothetical protein [Spirillospora albida]|uniref:hypothetical protein n=1 Tax=Spirillospora albida TaxID=58123 RepID=UPI0004C1E375|nr:hypothetical protein [Spirillospora albida]